MAELQVKPSNNGYVFSVRHTVSVIMHILKIVGTCIVITLFTSWSTLKTQKQVQKFFWKSYSWEFSLFTLTGEKAYEF